MPQLAAAVLILCLSAAGAHAFSAPPEAETDDASATGEASTPTLPAVPPLDGSRVPLLGPGEAKAQATGSATQRREKSGLARHLGLRLRPAPLSSGTATGRRMGYTDFTLRLPFGHWFDFRTGVRLDYDNRPAEEDWAVDGTPTFGFGLRF